MSKGRLRLYLHGFVLDGAGIRLTGQPGQALPQGLVKSAASLSLARSGRRLVMILERECGIDSASWSIDREMKCLG